MRKISDLLDDFSIDSIRKFFNNSPKYLEYIGYEISPKSKFENIQIFEKNYCQKYFGNLKEEFVMSIKREFFVKAYLTENSQKRKLFKESLVYEGRYHLRNIGNEEVEALPNYPFFNMGNVIWNLCKSE